MGQLYAALGVTELDEPALLERFVLPRFPSLPAPQQAAARAQVRRHWHTLQTRPKVVDILKTTPLVSVHGSLLRADQLLDPANSLLAAIFRGDCMFPTDDMATDEWLQVCVSVCVCVCACAHACMRAYDCARVPQ